MADFSDEWDMAEVEEAEKRAFDECYPGGVLPFQGPRDPLSNFYPCEIAYGGRTFSSAEQLYQYRKCVCHRDYLTAELVMRTKTARESKAAARNVVEFSADWDRVAVMREVAACKYRQVPEVRRELLERHRDAYIVEAVRGDLFWSCGYDKRRAASVHPTLYPGRNEMGRIWMRVREREI